MNGGHATRRVRVRWLCPPYDLWETAGRGSNVWLHCPCKRTRRHDEPGTERPDNPDRPKGRLREADADVLAAGGAGRRVAGATAGQGDKTARRESGAVS